MSDIAIRVENLSKAYRIGLAEQRHETLASALVSAVRSPWENLRNLRKLSRFDDAKPPDSIPSSASGHPSSVLRPPSSPASPSDIFWALKDVSFEVKHGEVLGIIGSNGAGKSTLLKILSRITEPTSGQAQIYGRVASLLEVGTGFHPDLTGRENVYLNGTILGMRKREIDAKFDEIVAFSGVEKFIDTPVKRYSSGMRVRLAFAVAAHLDPEILIIDEVLAVGDAEFQKKCLGKMHDVATQGRTVLFVSHNMGAVLNLCERVLLLGGGCILRDGTASSSIQEHLESTADNLTMFWNRSGDLPSTSLEIRTARAELLGSQPNHKLLLEINCTSLSQHKSGIIVLDVLDLNETAIMQIIPSETPFMEYQHGVHSLKIEVLLPPLIPGRYRIAAWIGSNHDSRLDQVPSLLAFEITAFPDPNRTFPYVRSHGSIIAPSKFSYEKTQPQLQNK